MKDENEECGQLPNECSTCDGSVVRKPEESQANELLFFHLLANQIFASVDPNERASGSRNAANCRADRKDVSIEHQNEASHLLKTLQRYHENSGMIADTVEPNSQASVVSAHFSILPSTSQDKSDYRGNVLGLCPCPVCGGRYVDLATHMRIHSTDKHVCSVCKKEFRAAGHLKNHMVTHTDERPYKCRDCNDRFQTAAALKNHEETHASGSRGNLLAQGPSGYKESSNVSAISSGLSSCEGNKIDGVAETLVDDRPQCNICGRRFVRQRYLDNHMNIHTGEKPYKCSFCDKKYRDCHQLTLHELGHKGMLPQCNVCGGRYASLSAHMLTHSTDNFVHVCSTCNKAFRKAYSLKEHMKTHSNERPYTCAHCGALFRSSTHVKKHMVTHTKERKHMCTVCGKTFGTTESMKSHMSTHSGEKPYSCDKCNRSCTTSSLLARHRLTHTSLKPFICSTCGKQFRTDTGLLRHKLIHSGEQPYECSICGMKFNQSCSMKRHMLVHTGEKPYSCSDCGERFTQSGGLASHRRRHCPMIKNQ